MSFEERAGVVIGEGLGKRSNRFLLRTAQSFLLKAPTLFVPAYRLRYFSDRWVTACPACFVATSA